MHITVAFASLTNEGPKQGPGKRSADGDKIRRLHEGKGSTPDAISVLKESETRVLKDRVRYSRGDLARPGVGQI